MSCTYIDLPPEFEPLPGKQLMKIKLRSSGAIGPEVLYTFVMPRSVLTDSIASALTAVAALDADAGGEVVMFPGRHHADTA